MTLLKQTARYIATMYLVLTGATGIAQTLETSTWIHHERQAPTREISSLHQLPDGFIAAVTDSSLNVFDGIKWQKHLIPDDIPPYTKPFFSDRAGNLFFFNHQTIYRWNATSPEEPVETIVTDLFLNPLSGDESADGVVYFGLGNTVNGGIYRLEDSELILVRAGQVRSFAVAADGIIWAVSKESSSAEYRLWSGTGDNWEDRTASLGGITNVTRVFAAPDGSVWFNNEENYTVYQDNSWEYFGGGVQKPKYLSFDTSGDVWGISVGGGKLFRRNQDGNWVTRWEYDSDNATPYFFVSGSGERRFIADGKKVHEYDESAITDMQKYPWRELYNPHDLGSDMVTCIAYTNDGFLICGHGDSSIPQEEQENAGISIFNGETWSNFSMATNGPATFRFGNVYALSTLKSGDVIASSNFALNMMYDGSNWSYIDSLYTDAPTDYGWRYANDYIETSNDELWVATTAGLLYHDYEYLPDLLYAPLDIGSGEKYNYRNLYEEDSIVYFQNNEGVIISYDPSNTNDPWNRHYGVTTVLRDFIIIEESGNPWVWGALQDGIYRILDLTSERVKDAATGEFIPLPNASLITIDDDDHIWASGYGNTGYIDDDGVWHRIEALGDIQATTHAFYDLDKIAFNATRINRTAETETIDYMGVYTYDADLQSAVEEQPVVIDLARNYPNPFNASTTISFTLSEPGKTTVSVYSLTGQHIRTLTDRTFISGTHRIRWDGRNDTGQVVGSGIYVFRIASAHTTLTGKMVLVK